MFQNRVTSEICRKNVLYELERLCFTMITRMSCTLIDILSYKVNTKLKGFLLVPNLILLSLKVQGSLITFEQF